MTDPADAKPRRRLAFRVLSLLLLVLFLAFGGRLGWMIYRAKVQHDTVAQLRKAGMSITYAWELQRDGRSFWDDLRPLLGWVVDRSGRDFLSEVTAVGYRGKVLMTGDDTRADDRMTDELMADVARFDRLNLSTSTPRT